MKINQYHQCDWNKTNPTEIADAAVNTTHRGVTMVIPVGTDKRGYTVILDLSVADLLEMTAIALAAEAEERKGLEAVARARANATRTMRELTSA